MLINPKKEPDDVWGCLIDSNAPSDMPETLDIEIGKSPCCVCKLPLTIPFYWLAMPMDGFISAERGEDFFCHEKCRKVFNKFCWAIHGERN